MQVVVVISILLLSLCYTGVFLSYVVWSITKILYYVLLMPKVFFSADFLQTFQSAKIRPERQRDSETAA